MFRLGGCLLSTHFVRNATERRLFNLCELQFKEVQQAQVNERQAADSKRRLTWGQIAHVDGGD
jgi:osomolarity two-component system, sensor histidine kinase SLN1